jgi:hypothetical protein
MQKRVGLIVTQRVSEDCQAQCEPSQGQQTDLKGARSIYGAAEEVRRKDAAQRVLQCTIEILERAAAHGG